MTNEHGHLFDSLEAARQFTFAGEAVLTLVSHTTGARFTYRVSSTVDEAELTKPIFVSLLVGQDNDHDYRYLGFIKRTHLGDLRWSARSCASQDAPSFRAFAWYLKMLAYGDRIAPNLEVWHEGRCERCGRRLTVPESIAMGLGPECAALMGMTRVKEAQSELRLSWAEREAGLTLKDISP